MKNLKISFSYVLLLAVFVSLNLQASDQDDLYDAIKNKQTQNALSLIEKGVDANFEYTFSPLVLAIQTDQYEIVKALINNGADAQFRELFPFSAFEIALRKPDTQMMDLLIKLQPDIDLDFKNLSDNGHTPLMQMAQLGDMEKIHWLLNKGADLYAKDSYNDQILAIAAYHGQKEVVAFLLTKNVDINNQNASKYRAIDYAKNRGHDEIAKMIQTKAKQNESESGSK